MKTWSPCFRGATVHGRPCSQTCGVRSRTTPAPRALAATAIEEVEFRVTPPEYTRRAPYVDPMAGGTLTALAGTRVEVTARSNRPLRPRPVELPLPEDAGSRAIVGTTLPLADYGLTPGDVIRLFARVEDNDPAGPKGAESEIVEVHIISTADFQRLVLMEQGMETLQAKYWEAQRRLESAANELERMQKALAARPGDSPMSEADQTALRELADRLAEEADAIEDLAAADLAFDLDRELTPQLREMNAAVAAASKAAAALAQSAGSSCSAGAKSLEEARRALKERGQRFQEGAMQPLDQLAKIYLLMEDQARFVALYQRQRSLADRLSALKGQDKELDAATQRRVRDLETEQRQVQIALADLLEDISDHVTLLPDTPEVSQLRQTAVQFVQAVRESQADAQMTSAGQALAGFQVTAGWEQATAAADTLERFISKCQSMAQGARECLPRFQPKLSGAMNSTVDQLLASAGLKSGAAPGTGAGYSAARTSLQNIGLYGSLPAFAGGSSAGRRPSMSGGGSAGSDQGETAASASLPVLEIAKLRAAGQAEAEAPAPYRRRVGAYFKRITEEAGE